MSFATNAITLPGSSLNTQPLKSCCRCLTDREQGGGIDLGSGRWCCAGCWVRRHNPGNTGNKKAKTS